MRARLERFSFAARKRCLGIASAIPVFFLAVVYAKRLRENTVGSENAMI